MKKYLTGFLILSGLILLTIWASKGLFEYSIYQTHDLDHHLVRTLDAVQTLREGSFPLRWAGILNFECGTPIYNFFNPLFYYISAGTTVLTHNIINSIKLISVSAMFMGSLFLYLWLKNETNNLSASFAGALLYLYAPYRFVLIYVRGDPEYLAYAILPVIFYFYSLAFKKRQPHFLLYLFLASIAGGLLSMAHNVVFLLSIPIITIYLLLKVFIIKERVRSKLLPILFSYVSIFGFGAFFIFPALLEEKFTQIGIPVFWYKDHFPTLSQLIYSPWGYGDSAIGIKLDGMSFQLGFAHWVALLISCLFLVYQLYLSKFRLNLKFIFNNLWVGAFTLLSILFIFIDLPVSNFVWEKITILQAMQFPWRILGISIFTLSTLFAFLVSRIKQKLPYFLLLFSIPLLALYSNRNNLLPQPVYQNTLPFYENLSTLKYERNSVTQVQDNVLPAGKLSQCLPKTPVVVTDKGEPVRNQEIRRGSTYGSITINLDKNAISGEEIIMNLDYFPGIFIFNLNNKLETYYDCEGRVCFLINDFKNGENNVMWKVVQTPTEHLFNFISTLFVLLWLMFFVFRFIFSKLLHQNSQKS